MYSTVVRCSMPDCQESAVYKIAAPWSDGRFSELKTYGHACSKHLGPVFRDSDIRRARYKAAPGESIDELAIYRYEPGRRDRQLQRLRDLEKTYRSWGSGPEGV
jgi:hypothetical protein